LSDKEAKRTLKDLDLEGFAAELTLELADPLLEAPDLGHKPMLGHITKPPELYRVSA